VMVGMDANYSDDTTYDINILRTILYHLILVNGRDRYYTRDFHALQVACLEGIWSTCKNVVKWWTTLAMLTCLSGCSCRFVLGAVSVAASF
jgi:hypothetical protein